LAYGEESGVHVPLPVDEPEVVLVVVGVLVVVLVVVGVLVVVLDEVLEDEPVEAPGCAAIWLAVSARG
jgi:hypothetical protein